MLDLVLTILFSALIVTLLRGAGQARADLLTVVAINYLTAAVFGLFFTPEVWSEWSQPAPWQGLALLQGTMFVAIFFSIGNGAKILGLGFTGVVIKLSVLFPVLVSWWLYDEPLGPRQIFGLALALSGILLLNAANLGLRRPSELFSRNRKRSSKASKASTPEERRSAAKRLGLTAFLFLGTGVADSNFKIFGQEFGAQIGQQAFVVSLFSVAALVSTLAVLVRWVRGRRALGRKELLWGVLVGVPNWYSLVFLLRGLADVPGSVFFPINNIGQLLLVNLAGLVVFREKLSVPARWGLAAAVAAIALLAE